MAPHFVFLFFFLFLCSPHKINSCTCTLDFGQFPYEAHSECFDITAGSFQFIGMDSCCSSALQSVLKAIALKSNRSRSIFLESAEAQNCSSTFQNYHPKTHLAKCNLQDFISSSTPNLCSNNIDSIRYLIGNERFNAFQSNCKGLSFINYTDDACYNFVQAYRQSLQVLKNSDSSNGERCPEALLVSLASSDVNSPNRVQGTLSCLWNEIKLPWPKQKHNKVVGNLLGSKKVPATVIVAVTLVILVPVLYKLTKKHLQYASEKDIENLSVIALRKELEEESKSAFNSHKMKYPKQPMGLIIPT
ncbi:proline-rich receptor-like protein kinase PERK15 [Quillaja saponaria]|uniref:Proline-rich receptor-like protein kinase PERK15 n=1 Tax=Quillaja saponaria TaxID=32244 RepID=A0AAD7PHA5_QUISA|nr:proline-rich receptor-like protein kinase PERK15 [Quillaja saponaria]